MKFLWGYLPTVNNLKFLWWGGQFKVHDGGTPTIPPPVPISDLTSFKVRSSSAPEDCINQGLVPYQGRCWELNATGPCQDGQWLVLSRGRTGGVSCRTRPCPRGQVMWRGRKCADLGSPNSDCSSATMVVTVNAFGSGVCGCPLDTEYNGQGDNCVSLGTKTLLVLPYKDCENGFSRNHDGICKRISGRIQSGAKDKRRTLESQYRTIRGQRLISFLRHRFG